VQDSNGVLYFGCDDVLSFDGERWRPYPVPGGYLVRGMAIGSNGRLWVGAFNEIGYFDRTETGLSTYHSLVGYLPEKDRALHDVWQAAALGNGAVFVTTDRILVWDGQAFKTYAMPGARRLFVSPVDGRILVFHPPTGVWSLDNDGLSKFISADTLNHAGVLWMEDSPSGWLIATSDGLLSYKNGVATELGAELSAFIRKNALVSVCRLPNGNLCLGTILGGIAVVSPQGDIKETLSTDVGMLSRTTYSLFTAHDGTVWATSPVGITHIDFGSGVSTFDSRQGLTGKPSHSIAQSANSLLVATAEGVFGLPIGGQSEPFHSLPEMSGLYYRLESSKDGSVYAAGFKRVDRIEQGHAVHAFSSINDIFLFRPSAAEPGSFIAISDYDVMRVVEDAKNGPRITMLGHIPDGPTSMAEDRDGNIWVATLKNGAFLIRGDSGAPAQRIRVGESAGADDTAPVAVARVGDDVALFTRSGAKLYSSFGRPPLPLEASPKRAAIAVSNCDASGSMWIAFESPFTEGKKTPVIGRLSVSPDGQNTWRPYAVPGLPQLGEVLSLFVDSRGIVWVGGSDGLLRLDPKRLEPVGTPRPPLLAASIGRDDRLPSDRNSVSFDFSPVEFSRRSAYRFETRLSGGRSEWSAPTNDNHLLLAGLQSGRYEFAVRLVNEAGMIGPASVLRFAVLPPWNRTLPALIGFGLLGLAGFYGALQWRLAFLRRQNVRLEALVKKKTEQLEKANEAKSEFLANMSHEIRNPIQGILGLAMAFEDTPMDARQKHLADSINSCANLLSTLVDDVLDFSKIEAGKIELRSAPFSPRILLEQCVAMVNEEARAKGSTVSVSIAGRLPEQFIGDGARIQQIVLNYLTNALKFGGGKPIIVGAAPGFHDRVRYFVKDNGPGMTEADMSTLFTKFTRLESARTSNIRGTGLGLAVCRLLAGKMGGRVGVESKLGEGSTFWAEIPFLEVKEHGKAEAPKSSKTTTLRALIVEDIDYNVIAMQAVLRKLDIQSDVVTDGNAALECLKASFYDVVFLDWSLPGLNGIEVAAKYRAAEPPTRRSIIIATTAHSAEMNREACLKAGMDAFIAKPITPDKIAAALRDLRGSLRTAGSIEVRSQNITLEPPGEIDLEMLRFLGNETLEGLSNQIDRFLSSFDSDRIAARGIIATGERTEIHRIAHRLLSHCSVVKHQRLSQIAVEIQRSSASASLDRIQRLFSDFEAEFAAFRYKLESIRASIGPA
jgi:signal transduction histidine kinase/ActR/RegA family two-component response regulator/HPt (histidine-containing phosphotransfer) domain-containing protein